MLLQYNAGRIKVGSWVIDTCQPCRSTDLQFRCSSWEIKWKRNKEREWLEVRDFVSSQRHGWDSSPLRWDALLGWVIPDVSKVSAVISVKDSFLNMTVLLSFQMSGNTDLATHFVGYKAEFSVRKINFLHSRWTSVTSSGLQKPGWLECSLRSFELLTNGLLNGVLLLHFNCCSFFMFTYLYRVIQNDFRGTIVQRQFRTKFGKQPPSDNSIRRWYAQFQETGRVFIGGMKVRIRTAIETITVDMRNELNYRVDVCRITKGAHIEHL